MVLQSKPFQVRSTGPSAERSQVEKSQHHLVNLFLIVLHPSGQSLSRFPGSAGEQTPLFPFVLWNEAGVEQLVAQRDKSRFLVELGDALRRTTAVDAELGLVERFLSRLTFPAHSLHGGLLSRRGVRGQTQCDVWT